MKKRIDTSGGASPLKNNPFAGLEIPVPVGPDRPPAAKAAKRPKRNRGRIDVIRQTAGRGGKTVTVLAGFKGIGETELHELARAIQRTCGVGGTVKSGRIEIQGEQRNRACAALEAAGFRPVRAGG